MILFAFGINRKCLGYWYMIWFKTKSSNNEVLLDAIKFVFFLFVLVLEIKFSARGRRSTNRQLLHPAPALVFLTYVLLQLIV